MLAGERVELDDLQEGRITRSGLHTATDRIMGRITQQLALLRGEEPPAPAEPEHGTSDTALEPPATG